MIYAFVFMYSAGTLHVGNCLLQMCSIRDFVTGRKGWSYYSFINGRKAPADMSMDCTFAV
jgi:lysine/ornithine N-monooxygenase